jgi:hypothetical protein
MSAVETQLRFDLPAQGCLGRRSTPAGSHAALDLTCHNFGVDRARIFGGQLAQQDPVDGAYFGGLLQARAFFQRFGQVPPLGHFAHTLRLFADQLPSDKLTIDKDGHRVQGVVLISTDKMPSAATAKSAMPAA